MWSEEEDELLLTHLLHIRCSLNVNWPEHVIKARLFRSFQASLPYDSEATQEMCYNRACMLLGRNNEEGEDSELDVSDEEYDENDDDDESNGFDSENSFE